MLVYCVHLYFLYVLYNKYQGFACIFVTFGFWPPGSNWLPCTCSCTEYMYWKMCMLEVHQDYMYVTAMRVCGIRGNCALPPPPFVEEGKT